MESLPKSSSGPPTAILIVIVAGLLVTIGGVVLLSLPPNEPVIPVAAARPPAGSPFENTRPGVKYVGDAACTPCHAEIAAAFAQHPMGRSASPAEEVLPDTAGAVMTVGDQTYSLERRDGVVYQRETTPAGRDQPETSTEAPVPYALGAGLRGYAFLADRGGKLFQSPLGWSVAHGEWGLAPTFQGQNSDFDRAITLDCLFCHTNRSEIRDDGTASIVEPAIGCERCHGPGEIHVRQQRVVDGRDLTIVNPTALDTPRLREEVCEQCHHTGASRNLAAGKSMFDYRPGLPMDEVMTLASTHADPIARLQAAGHVGQMHNSRCYRSSAGKLSCVSCHDPHAAVPAESRVEFFRDRCLKCHTDRGCSEPLANREARGRADDCISCHMPPTGTTEIAHTPQTLHSIPRRAQAGPESTPAQFRSAPR